MLKKDELEREMREAHERRWGNDLAGVSITRQTYTELVRLALLGIERDTRVEQIGKLVLELWGTDPKPLRWSADHRAALDRIDSSVDHFHTVRLMRGIADILDQT